MTELEVRYTEMARVARERQASLLALQLKHAELESRCRELTGVVIDAGLEGEVGKAAEASAKIDSSLFSDSTLSSFRQKPPDGWPAEVQYTQQLLWEDVPIGRHMLRDRIADYGSVRRPCRLKIVLIKNKKHPCCGERGLYAAEDIPAGTPLLDYAGRVSVVIGEDPDTNRSSYLLSLFRDEEAGVYVDIDAAQCGNEGRFINDYHGTADAPNSQFWPYFDPVTGEKRMAVKTIRPLRSGEEILVDYGGSYFERDSEDDSDMHSSDDEYDEAPKKGGKRSAARPKLLGGSKRGGGGAPPGKKRKT